MYNRKNEGKAGALALMILVALALLAAGGYVANVVKLFHLIGGDITTLFIARGAGVFFPPLGAILGFFQ